MTDNHPITPPLELGKQWAHMLEQHTADEVFTQVARWGADQELEACCEWVPSDLTINGESLRAARRPKPPSLKEQALCHLESFAGSIETLGMDSDLIRRALEALPDG